MRALLILTASLALVAAGCTGSDGKAAPGGAPMTAQQYSELEKLYRAQIAAERLQEEGKERKALDAAARACAAVPGGDRLLDAAGEVCHESVEALASMLEIERQDCDGRRCAGIAREQVAVIDGLIATSRRADDEVAELVPHEGCRDALTTPSELYEGFALLSEAFGHLDDALRTGAEAHFRKAMSKLRKGQALVDDMPSARQFLARFRRACSA